MKLLLVLYCLSAAAYASDDDTVEDLLGAAISAAGKIGGHIGLGGSAGAGLGVGAGGYLGGSVGVGARAGAGAGAGVGLGASGHVQGGATLGVFPGFLPSAGIEGSASLSGAVGAGIGAKSAADHYGHHGRYYSPHSADFLGGNLVGANILSALYGLASTGINTGLNSGHVIGGSTSGLYPFTLVSSIAADSLGSNNHVGRNIHSAITGQAQSGINSGINSGIVIGGSAASKGGVASDWHNFYHPHSVAADHFTNSVGRNIHTAITGKAQSGFNTGINSGHVVGGPATASGPVAYDWTPYYRRPHIWSSVANDHFSNTVGHNIHTAITGKAQSGFNTGINSGHVAGGSASASGPVAYDWTPYYRRPHIWSSVASDQLANTVGGNIHTAISGAAQSGFNTGINSGRIVGGPASARGPFAFDWHYHYPHSVSADFTNSVGGNILTAIQGAAQSGFNTGINSGLTIGNPASARLVPASSADHVYGYGGYGYGGHFYHPHSAVAASTAADGLYGHYGHHYYG